MSFDLSLVGWNKFLATSSGRDKLGKFVHYGARGIAGYAAQLMLKYPKGSAEYAKAAFIQEKARALFVRLMDSRRTNRWLSSIPIIIALRSGKCPWREDASVAYIVAQLGMVWWHVIDHIRWLQQIGWVSGDQNNSKRISFRGFVLSSLINTWYVLTEIQRELTPGGDGKEDKKAEKEKFMRRLNLVKHLATVISTLHVSELFLSSEPICGACGALASVIDIYQMFPRVANKED
mmetsp:Transcript_10336/g.20343  ORF Transcript_10336/g.20343 Transcript_10336/m.20343 type:complete len:234 (+) Transcript_10336:187-888(+)